MSKKEVKTIRSKWYEFTPTWCDSFTLSYELAGYFDPRPVLQIYFIWGKLFLYLPWKHYKKIPIENDEEIINNKRKIALDDILDGKKTKIKKRYKKVLYDDCEPPEYGISIHDNAFWIHYGGCDEKRKYKAWYFPWDLEWIRRSALLKDGISWEHEYCKYFREKSTCDGNFWDKDKWGDILYYENHPYKYVLKNGTVQNVRADIRVQEMEWRWRWFKWLRWTRFVRKTIEIEFSSEVGERTGTWKGGTLGCSYTMLPNETPYECLKRMKKERKF